MITRKLTNRAGASLKPSPDLELTCRCFSHPELSPTIKIKLPSTFADYEILWPDGESTVGQYERKFEKTLIPENSEFKIKIYNAGLHPPKSIRNLLNIHTHWVVAEIDGPCPPDVTIPSSVRKISPDVFYHVKTNGVLFKAYSDYSVGLEGIEDSTDQPYHPRGKRFLNIDPRWFRPDVERYYLTNVPRPMNIIFRIPRDFRKVAHKVLFCTPRYYRHPEPVELEGRIPDDLLTYRVDVDVNYWIYETGESQGLREYTLECFLSNNLPYIVARNPLANHSNSLIVDYEKLLSGIDWHFNVTNSTGESLSTAKIKSVCLRGIIGKLDSKGSTLENYLESSSDYDAALFRITECRLFDNDIRTVWTKSKNPL